MGGLGYTLNPNFMPPVILELDWCGVKARGAGSHRVCSGRQSPKRCRVQTGGCRSFVSLNRGFAVSTSSCPIAPKYHGNPPVNLESKRLISILPNIHYMANLWKHGGSVSCGAPPHNGGFRNPPSIAGGRNLPPPRYMDRMQTLSGHLQTSASSPQLRCEYS